MNKEQRLRAAEYYPGVSYQQLFDHMSEEHGLTLLQGEMDEIIRIVKGAESEAESKWVSVEELPKAGSYLVWNPNLTSENKTERATYANYNNQWMNDCNDIIHPTHWQPLPQPPLNQQ